MSKIKSVIRKSKVLMSIARAILYLKRNGISKTASKIKHRIFKSSQKQSKMELNRQKRVKFDGSISFSILVPLFNTPDNLLRSMIESVQNQTFVNWELCLADASSDENNAVKDICMSYCKKDKRIKYKKICNEGISKNSNVCAEMATKSFLVLLDHDDIISPDALYENAVAIRNNNPDVIYSDEDKIDENGAHLFPFFKPDWSKDLLYSQMYICHLLVMKKSCFDRIKGFDSNFDGAQDYDLMLRLSEITEKIYHIPKLLYSWRITSQSTSVNPMSKPYAHTAGLKALDCHLKRMYGSSTFSEETEYTFVYSPRFPYKSKKVSIIIPMKDNWLLSDACVRSIVEKSTFKNFEILILDNRSEERESFEWLERICGYDNRVRVVKADFEFNWSKLNNFGIKNALGDVFIFLNNDISVISNDWIERLSENALRSDIGVAGALLLYEDNTIQHAGVVVGMGGWADHVFKGQQPVHFASPYVSPVVTRNVLAVTGACMAISRNTIEKIGMFDEEFIICGSDVEICLRAYQKGLRNIYIPYVKLYHYESKSRDSFIPDIDFKKSKEAYAPFIENGYDPYFNCNLDISSTIPKRKC